MWVILSIIIVCVISIILFFHQSKFGKTPQGKRLEQVKNSPNYHEGKFQNIHETPQITSDKNFIFTVFDFLFTKKERLRPSGNLPVIKTDLHKIQRDQDILIWFGHSSYLIQIDGIRILVDPVFSKAASPVSFYNKPFKGTEIYEAKDMPEVDYLIISHDHWDHLDYETIVQMKNRIGKVIGGLGVGEHFEYWGYEKDKIVELDWRMKKAFNNNFTVHCLPTRHFSGRGLSPNQSLWCSYLIETPSQKIYIGGDGGYDTHYHDIGEQFGEIDLAILENGQYDKNWKHIHLMPEEVVQAYNDLKAKKLFTVHHSKYALSNHPWDEPLKNISRFAEEYSINLILPMIGEKINLRDNPPLIRKWWEEID